MSIAMPRICTIFPVASLSGVRLVCHQWSSPFGPQLFLVDDGTLGFHAVAVMRRDPGPIDRAEELLGGLPVRGARRIGVGRVAVADQRGIDETAVGKDIHQENIGLVVRDDGLEDHLGIGDRRQLRRRLFGQGHVQTSSSPPPSGLPGPPPARYLVATNANNRLSLRAEFGTGITRQAHDQHRKRHGQEAYDRI